MRGRTFTSGVGAATALAVAAIAAAGVPEVEDAPNALLVLDTLSASVALLAALLVFGRFRRSALVSDVALVWAFFTLAAGNLVAAYVEPAHRVKLIAGVLGSLAVLVAAGARERSVGWRRAGKAVAATAGLIVPVFAIMTFLLVGDEIASGASRMAILVVTAAGFMAGAVAFTAQGDRDDDALARWLGAGCVIAGASRVVDALSDAPAAEAVHPADFARLVFVAFLVVGAVLEIRSYWVGAGVLEERRRVARELHDGMAQELATIVNETRRVRNAIAPDAIALYRISRAAERALDESRRAIHALTSPLDQPLDEAVAATAEDVAAREGAEVSLDLAQDVHVRGELREALVRIVREAVGNAARHGQADVIAVDLKMMDGGGLRITVRDDGRGFAPGSVGRGSGIGLTSMRERAAAVGATVEVTSSPGKGTSVEVTVPSPN